MSAFLGPIHIWLYNKIKFQSEMAETVFDIAEKNGCGIELREIATSRYGALEEGNLEDLIDGTNIHGWLQERVSLVENRLAYAVTEFLAIKPDGMSMIQEAIYELGRKNCVDKNITPGEAYENLEKILLNGMPCDHVNQLLENNDEKLVWRQAQDIHSRYWTLIGGDGKNYDIIRTALIKGMLYNSGVAFSQPEDQIYEIKRV